MTGKILLHNMTLMGIEKIPGILDYDQRAIVMANNDDTVVTRHKIESSYIKYLESLGYDFSETTFINSKSKSQTWSSIFDEIELKRAIKQNGKGMLDTYHVTELESDYAKEIGIPLYGNSDISNKYGTKSGFRKLAKKIGIPIVRGYENQTEPQKILEKVNLIHKRSNKCVVRLDEGVSGVGNLILDKSEFKKLTSRERERVISTHLEKIPQRIPTSGCTVEEWVENVTSSPSLQFEVNPNGEIILLSTHDQILEGPEKWYTGCSYPSRNLGLSRIKIINQCFNFMDKLSKEGFQGYCGIDLIITSKNYFFVEANIRKPGTTYPREFVRRVYNGLEGIYYRARDIQSPVLKGKNFNDLQNIFNKIIVSKKVRDGILIYNTGALADGGRFDVVIVSNDLTTLNELDRQFINLVNTLT